MITAVDTSVILDLLRGDSPFVENSLKLYRRAMTEGQLVICSVVWSELRPSFSGDKEMAMVMSKMNLEFDDLGKDVAMRAGVMWKKYRQGKGSRSRIIADFLIGAHAEVRSDRLLTRDEGFYRSYFSGLKLLT